MSKLFTNWWATKSEQQRLDIQLYSFIALDALVVGSVALAIAIN